MKSRRPSSPASVSRRGSTSLAAASGLRIISWFWAWMPTWCPSSSIRRIRSSLPGTFSPMRKKVTDTPRRANPSSRGCVVLRLGPSSKVSATTPALPGAPAVTARSRPPAPHTGALSASSISAAIPPAPSRLHVLPQPDISIPLFRCCQYARSGGVLFEQTAALARTGPLVVQ